MTKLLAASAILFFHALPAWPAEVSVSMMYSNATSDAQPYGLFEGKEWRAHERARFVKLHMYFDGEVVLSGFDLVPCKPDPALSELSYFVNFDDFVFSKPGEYELRLRAEQKILEEYRRQLALKRPERNEKEDSGADDDDVVNDGKARFIRLRVVRSITINFERKRGVRLCGITLFDGEGAPLKVRVPRIVAGSVSANNTLDPADAYAAPNLFDSRFEYAWATSKMQKGAALDFTFAQPATISRLMVWNGYQRSPTHCFQNARPRLLRIESEAGETAQARLEDRLGVQVVTLSRPLRGAKFRFTVDEAYAGSVYQDMAISELRFGDDAGWYLIDVSEHGRSLEAKNVKAFTAAGLAPLLNDGFSFGSTVLRLRADGSFYLAGTFEEKGGDDKSFFTLGGYEVLPGSKGRTLRLRLFGVYREEKVYGDCNGCGWDCNTQDAAGTMRGRIFQQNVTLHAPGDSGQADANIMLRTEGARRLRIDPTELKLQR